MKKKENLPKYSVLMSVYAKEKPEFLRASMMSVLEQTVPTDDFVLVCDGMLGEELNAAIKEMWGKFGKKLHVVRLAENRGLGHALRVGVEACKNDLVARMDADDVAVKNRCEKELQVLTKRDADVVGSVIDEYDERMKKKISRRGVPEKDGEIKEMMKKRNPMNHVTVMFRKTKVIEAGGYRTMPFFEDYDLWARMAKNGCKFYNIQKPLVKVRGGEGMTKRRGGVLYARNMARFQRTLFKNRVVTMPRMIVNTVGRGVVALIPGRARSVFYAKILREGRNVA